jgi:hypothetical protein
MNLRPRFSLRTAAIVVALACAYLATWPLTKRYGVPQIAAIMEEERSSIPGIPNTRFAVSAASPLPLVVGRDEVTTEELLGLNASVSSGTRTYYLWLFGPAIELPFSSEWKHTSQR